MKVEWKCASMTSGGQCVMTPGTTLMLLWSASSWDMHILEVSADILILPTYSQQQEYHENRKPCFQLYSMRYKVTCLLDQ